MNDKINYRLGFNISYNALGWAAVLLDKNEQAYAVDDFGVRIFPTGRDDKTKAPSSVKRRENRGARRNRKRFLKRRQKLLDYMLKIGLQPPTQQQRQQLAQIEPLKLRATGASAKLSPYELGRALFHLNQRRGFKSNRIAKRHGNEDQQGLKKGIDNLSSQLKENGQTLGQYLYQRALAGKPTRLKSGQDNAQRFTSRQMYIDEFAAIIEQQQIHHQFLTPKVVAKLEDIIFFQRPLKPQAAGFCTLIDGEKRARLAYPQVQQYRIYQEVNNLQIIESEYAINQEMRQKLLEVLSTTFIGVRKDGFLSWAKIASIIGIKGVKFNLDKKQRKGLKADTTTREMMAAVPGWWQGLTAAQKRCVIDAMQLAQSDEDLKNRLQQMDLATPQNVLEKLPQIALVDGYARISIAAIKKLLPYLKQGHSYQQASVLAGFYASDGNEDKIYCRGDLPFYGKVLPRQVIGGSYLASQRSNPEQFYGKINNPTVHILLNQLRLVLNELVEKYGCPPQEIYLEMGRQTALSATDLGRLKSEEARNRKHNQDINRQLAKLGIAQNYANRMKYKLWEDLDPDPAGRCCPLSGTAISHDNLFSAQIEVEHILPFARSYDNSRNNKMLCTKSANQLKGKRTPFEAFGASENWQEILARAQKMAKGSQHVRGFNINKYWRFLPNAMQLEATTDGFLKRQFYDNRYMSRIVKSYAEFVTGKQHLAPRVHATKGKYTADLRYLWGLDELTGDFVDGKFIQQCSNYHHHAIDAVVVALSDLPTIVKFAAASEQSSRRGRKKLKFDQPYAKFSVKKLKQRLTTLVISHKLDHKSPQLARQHGGSIGQLHEDTNYGHVRDNIYVTRKALFGSDFNTQRKIDEIAARHIRAAVSAIFNSFADANGRILSANNNDYARAIEEYKLKHNIKKVRILAPKVNLIPISNKDGVAYRHVVGGNNFGAELWVSEKGKNAGKWQCEIIRNFDVNQRGFVPQYKRDNPAAMKVMRLQINDMLALERDGKKIICRVQKMSIRGQISLRHHNDSSSDFRTVISVVASSLQAQNARKIFVSPAGKVYDPGGAKRPKW